MTGVLLPVFTVTTWAESVFWVGWISGMGRTAAVPLCWAAWTVEADSLTSASALPLALMVTVAVG